MKTRPGYWGVPFEIFKGERDPSKLSNGLDLFQPYILCRVHNLLDKGWQALDALNGKAYVED